MDLSFWLLEYQLDQMSRYLDLVQTSIQNYGQELEKSYVIEMNKDKANKEIAFIEADYEDRFIEAGQDFPRLLLSSFIISWYSFVEQELLNLCEQLKLNISIGPKENEYFNKGIRRAYKFLHKAKNYEIDTHQWGELIEIGKLRNQIVHSGNQIKCSYDQFEGNFASYTLEGEDIYIRLDKSLFNYLHKYNLLEFKMPPFTEIVPNPEYGHHLVKFGKDFFYKLHKDLKPERQILRSRRAR